MCNLSELIEEKGVARGEEAKAVEIALNLITGGVLDDEQIASATGLSVDKVKDLHTKKS